MSGKSQFGIFIVLATLVGAGLIYRDRHEPAAPALALAATTLWSAADISSYSYRIIFSGRSHPPPMQVLVTDGAVSSAQLYCPPSHTELQCQEWQESWKGIYGPEKLPSHAETIPQLLARIAALRDDRNARILAEFDPAYGYPMRFSFDIPNSDDEERGFEISQFAIVQ